MFVMEAAEDDIAPVLRFVKSDHVNGLHAQLLLYTRTQHMGFAFDWIRQGGVFEGTLDIDARDSARDGRHSRHRTGKSRS